MQTSWTMQSNNDRLKSEKRNKRQANQMTKQKKKKSGRNQKTATQYMALSTKQNKKRKMAKSKIQIR